MGFHYSRFLKTTIVIGEGKCMWGKKKRAKADALEFAYVQRLQEIDESNQPAGTHGLTLENLKSGQTDYLGEVTSGDYSGYLVLVSAMGMLSEDPGRNESDLWLSSNDLSVGIMEFNMMILRSSERQKPLPKDAWDFYYKTLPQLLDILVPMRMRWSSAVDAYKFINEPNSSPDYGID
jgi:hypothetical protein